jgi:hypothetical protein
MNSGIVWFSIIIGWMMMVVCLIFDSWELGVLLFVIVSTGGIITYFLNKLIDAKCTKDEGVKE